MTSTMSSTYLNFIGLVLNRLPPESKENLWAQSLSELLVSKNHVKNKPTMFSEIHQANIVMIQKIGEFCNKMESSECDQNDEPILSPLCHSIIYYVRQFLEALELVDVDTGKLNVSSDLLHIVREELINALEAFNSVLRIKNRIHPNELSKFQSCSTINIDKIGGTALQTDTFEEILSIIESPYLPPLTNLQQENTYTLVLDLDETLVHYFEIGGEAKFLVRPGVTHFLTEMSKFYEIVIFTAAIQDYADWAIDQIDPDGLIKYRLYRQHAIPCGPVYIKDLSRVGRDLRHMIIVDNVPENFQLQQDNGIFITSWFDDITDTALIEL